VREIALLGGDVSSMVPAHVETALKRKVEEMGEAALALRARPFGVKIRETG
jgi:hypothetical protein